MSRINKMQPTDEPKEQAEPVQEESQPQIQRTVVQPTISPPVHPQPPQPVEQKGEPQSNAEGEGSAEEQIVHKRKLRASQLQSEIVKRDQKGEVVATYTQVVQIVRMNGKKPNLGGYQNVQTGARHFNAFAQTDQRVTLRHLYITRQTQTHQYRTLSTSLSRQAGTQMERQGLYISTRLDVIAKPRPYFDSEMWQQRRVEAALYIQRMVRGWFAKRKTNELKRQNHQQQQRKLQADQEFTKNEEIKHRKEIYRRRHPRTKEDFRILYQELQHWRSKEIQRIKSDTRLTQLHRKKALKEVLDKETDLLQTIDRLKIIANKQNKEEKINKFLKSMSDPKRWLRSDGRLTQVHTPFTIRAKQLMDIYRGLKVEHLSIDERLDVLLNTKWTVKQHETDLTRDIVELIDRQANMLDRGRPEASLQGLRRRLASLFLMFIQYPDFNPQAARFQKIPYEFAKLVKEK